MTDEWDDPQTDSDSEPFQNPIARGLMQVVMGVIIFVALGTFVFNDPLQESVTQGLLFGIAYAAIYAAFQYFRE